MNNQHDKIGDTHNFGKYVYKKINSDKRVTIIKPRHVYWEKLFFGIDSELIDFISKFDSRFQKFKQVIVINNTLLQSEEVFLIDSPESMINKKLDDILMDFMDLCAYSLYFGLMDLNAENIFFTKENGFTIIDNEIVLNNIPSLSATGLIPNRAMLYRMTSISKIFIRNYAIQPELIAKALSRFSESFKVLSSNAKQIYFFLQKLDTDLLDYPVRIIIRDTFEYASLLGKRKEELDSLLYKEEVEQIIRGDIPYFFYNLSEASFKYFCSEKMDSAYVSNDVLSYYKQKYITSLPNIKYLNGSEPFVEKEVYSLLELLDIFSIISNNNKLKIATGDYSFEINNELAIVTIKNAGSWALVRQYENDDGVPLLDLRHNELQGEVITKADSEASVFIKLE